MSVDKDFEQRLNLLGEESRQTILDGLAECHLEEKEYYRLVYGRLPISDLVNTSPTVMLDYIRHGLFLKKLNRFGQQIPEDVFIDYVLSPRVHTEVIEPCRPFFYDQLAPMIKGQTMTEAIITLNYWALGEVTYQPTDERTSTAVAIWRRAYGRCGEESTFFVAVLRSLGIPARVVYVPWWSHCDDNHAWVEAWADGQWYYLGACEPEPVLNLGWFNHAASRAMLVHNKAFLGETPGIEVLNQTQRYAPVTELRVTFVNNQGQPLRNVAVKLQVLNFAEMVDIYRTTSDSQGQISCRLGQGSVYLQASYQAEGDLVASRAECLLPTITSYELRWSEISGHCQSDIDGLIFVAPVDVPQPGQIGLTDSQEKERQLLYNQYNRQRAEKETNMLGDNPYVTASKNNPAIALFLKTEELPGKMADRQRFLDQLLVKDLTDISYDALIDHFSALDDEKVIVGQEAEEYLFGYILNPRVAYEPITPYRQFIKGYFSEEQKTDFRGQPTAIWTYIRQTCCSYKELEYDRLTSSPVALLKNGIGNEQSQKILFVAICRSLGIPAGLDAIDHSLIYYHQAKWHRLSQEAPDKQQLTGQLCLIKEEKQRLKYRDNWSLAIRQTAGYQTLDLEKEEASNEWKQNELKLELPMGDYRLLTTNRLPNGDQYFRRAYFQVTANQSTRQSIKLQAIPVDKMLKRIELTDVRLDGQRLSGEAKTSPMISSLQTLTSGQVSLCLWLEPGKEPTEHILRELLAEKAYFISESIPVYLFVENQEASKQTTLQQVTEALPVASLYSVDFSKTPERLARRTYVQPQKLPLLLVIDEDYIVNYAHSGYQVGTIRLVTDIIETMKGQRTIE